MRIGRASIPSLESRELPYLVVSFNVVRKKTSSSHYLKHLGHCSLDLDYLKLAINTMDLMESILKS